ncbi:MAG: hypothetical protein K6G72_01305 [Lachnospiraceae bacterium]|nr:hypothetical protein [Lachnospiraceae bacterium]
MTAITLFIFAWGIYLIYMTVKMKASGVIPKQMLSNKINLDRAKDIPGYINHMYKINMIFGILICVLSGILIYENFRPINEWVHIAANAGYLVGLIVYAVIAVKTQNKYLI